MKKKLKKYRVSVTVVAEAIVDVRAESEDMARHIAKQNFDIEKHPMLFLDVGAVDYYPVREIKK